MADPQMISIFNRLADDTHKIAENLQKLVEEPLVEVQQQQRPAQCPHCAALNPKVNVPKHDAIEGRLNHYFLEVKCSNCGNVFWAMPAGWHITNNYDAITKLAEQVERELNV